MEAISSTEGAPREDLAYVEAPNDERVPTSYRDASVDTSDIEGGMVATNGDRERMQVEVVEVLGVMLPSGAGLPDDVPAVPTSSTDAPNPTGTGFQRIQRREGPDSSTRAPGDPPHDPVPGTGGGIPRVQVPGLVQRLQLVTIARLRQERDQLRRQLAEARAARVTVERGRKPAPFPPPEGLPER